MAIAGTVTELWCYPIKSMAGHRVEKIEVDELGFAGDRRYALRDLDSGKILSGKHPRIGRLLLALSPSVQPDGTLTVELDGENYSTAESERFDSALSDYIGQSVALVVASGEAETYESIWPEIEGLALSNITVDLPIAMSTQPGTFVDLAAIHIMTTATISKLQALNPGVEVDSRRFRPSIVVQLDDVDAFAENTWDERSANVGTTRLTLGGSTPRCVMTTLEQPKLAGSKQILQSIADNNRQTIDGLGAFACAGLYAEVDTPGTVTIGSPVKIGDAAGG